MSKKQEYTSRMYERDLGLVRAVAESGINPDGVFDDLELKESILRDYGYRGLKGGGRLDEVSDSQLGTAFMRIYTSAIERSEEYQSEMDRKREEQRKARALEPLQNDLFPEMFSHIHSDDGSLDFDK